LNQRGDQWAPEQAFRGRSCVVTGGLGFIGSNLALRLARHGADVTVIDALHPRHGGNRVNLHDEGDATAGDAIRVVEDDLGAPDSLAAAAAAEIVFNLAGQVSHVDSMQQPLFDLDVNTRSHVALLEGLRHDNPDATVVFTSTRSCSAGPATCRSTRSTRWPRST
jgi:UDP-glucose 4-epimerase